MGVNKLYKLSELLDHEMFLQVTHEVEKQADQMTVEGITNMVNEIVANEIIKSMDEPSNETGHSAQHEVSPILTSRIETISKKVAKQMQNLNKAMLGIEIESFLSTHKTAEALKILEKASVNIRRLLLCLRRIEKLNQD